MFFVATSPLQSDGLINCSPKGLDTLKILGPNEVAYLDFPGSGVETIAHLKENKRIVIMMCAFEGPPKIIRLHGQGEVIEPHHQDFDSLMAQFPEQSIDYCRAIIYVKINRIADSCGFGVPLYKYVKQRDSLVNFFNKTPKQEIDAYLDEFNQTSLDGLPAISSKKSSR